MNSIDKMMEELKSIDNNLQFKFSGVDLIGVIDSKANSRFYEDLIFIHQNGKIDIQYLYQNPKKDEIQRVLKKYEPIIKKEIE